MKQDYTKATLELLKGLKRQYPSQELSNHLFGALVEYDGKFWGLSDRELHDCLFRYSETLSIDEQHDYQLYVAGVDPYLEDLDDEDDEI